MQYKLSQTSPNKSLPDVNFTIPTNKEGAYTVQFTLLDPITNRPTTKSTSPQVIQVDDKDRKYYFRFQYDDGHVVNSATFNVPAGKIAEPVVSGSYQLASDKNDTANMYYVLDNIYISNTNSIPVSVTAEILARIPNAIGTSYTTQSLGTAFSVLYGNSSFNLKGHIITSNYTVEHLVRNGNIQVNVTFAASGYTPASRTARFVTHFFNIDSTESVTATTTNTDTDYGWSKLLYE